jgi:hypothetical protein
MDAACMRPRCEADYTECDRKYPARSNEASRSRKHATTINARVLAGIQSERDDCAA